MKPNLASITKEFEGQVGNNEIAAQIKGIGSYFKGKKQKPSDVDYVIKLSVPFSDSEVEDLSNSIEALKDKYTDARGNPLLNVFLEDSQGNKLNSVDLWYVYHGGESLQDNIQQRKSELDQYQKEWNKGIVIKDNSSSQRI
jgi:hypothetical protein